MWIVCKCAVALCLLGIPQVVWTASLQNTEEPDHVKLELPKSPGQARSSAASLSSIIGIPQVVLTAPLQNTEEPDHVKLELPKSPGRVQPSEASLSSIIDAAIPQGVAAGDITKVVKPAPITISSENGVTTKLQLVLLVVEKPAQQCQANAGPLPSQITCPVETPEKNSNFDSPTTPQSTQTPISQQSTNNPPNYVDNKLPPAPEPSSLQPPMNTTPSHLISELTAEPTQGPLQRPTRAPTFPPVENSQLLLKRFRDQVPKNPWLPPIITDPLERMIGDSLFPEGPDPSPPFPFSQPRHDPATSGISPKDLATVRKCLVTCKARSPINEKSESLPSPPLPIFINSLKIKAILTVYKADYSEPYTLWWDTNSGMFRMDYHEETASTYRVMRPDGLVHSIQMRLDRTGETDVRHCVTLTPRRMELAERALPVLPDLTGFEFAGYVQVPTSGPVKLTSVFERWQYTIKVKGGTPDEVLTYRHELLVARAANNFTTTPVRYAVTIDSSVLGENSDSYIHLFIQVKAKRLSPSMFEFNIEEACDTLNNTDDIDVVEPLREFALLQRNPKHETDFQEYKKSFNRIYANITEETVRKNILMQTSRLVSSSNRMGDSSRLEVNFLSDRLVVERRELLGAEEGISNISQLFSHSDEELSEMRAQLPLNFDWRKHGAVTSVRYQGTCKSCWAFSVVGAVEGALFLRTGRLVPLSEQCLIDCGSPFGTRGCKPTWPKFAYDYVVRKGLPALNEYTPYKEQVEQCKDFQVQPITRISGHVNVTSNNTLALKAAIKYHGPTIVLLDAYQTPSFAAYKDGFYYDGKCKKDDANHAMLAVGWTLHRGETYFILKNWWSEWGDDGYIKVRAPTNTCGMLRLPSYPVLTDNDVLRNSS